MIKDNVANIQKTIQETLDKSSRQKEDVTLIAVSKTKPIKAIQEVYEAGIKDFGENRVQELRDKMPALPKDIRWHMIGHLQKNKIKYIIQDIYMIHSVDSLSLAEEISKHALKINRQIPVLLEVNIGEEDSKFGYQIQELYEDLTALSALEGIQIKGLMCVPPFSDDMEDSRPYFKKLFNLMVDIASKNIDNIDMNSLSMGMSGDFPIAIEEGANYLRIGTSIFGERDYW